MSYDVVVVGAGIAGCTAATFYGRAGLKVALVESHADPQHHKVLCTHFIQGSAGPTITRLGLDGAFAAAGAVPTTASVWTRWGWIDAPDVQPHAWNLRREKLDPLLRRTASETDGVDVLLGRRVVALREREGRVAGVEAEARDGARQALDARLVVAADGNTSPVGELAGVKARRSPNGRFVYFAYFEDLPLSTGPGAQMWFLDPDMAYAFPSDDGSTLLGAFPTKARLPEFRSDREGAFLRYVEALPEGPPVAQARRVSKIIGTVDYPSVRRALAARPGLTFAGDAAATGDPLWGVGCGWAFQSAEWLAEATAPALRDGGDVDRAVRAYARRHRFIRMHQLVISDYSSGRRLNPIERLVMAAAVRDERTALRMEALGNRRVSVARALGPQTVGRAAWVNLTRRRARSGDVHVGIAA